MHGISVALTITGLILLALIPATPQQKRAIDELTTGSGTYSDFLINDSTHICLGQFTLSSASGQTRITAHRLRVSGWAKRPQNEFCNDLVQGVVFSDGVDLHASSMLFPSLLHISADAVVFSHDSLSIQLDGHATVTVDDLSISANHVNVFLTRLKSSPF
jgi:hypothetical protein